MIWDGHPWRCVWGLVFMGTAHRAQNRTLSCACVWKRVMMRIHPCRYFDFGPSLDGLGERLYRNKFIVTFEFRSFV